MAVAATAESRIRLKAQAREKPAGSGAAPVSLVKRKSNDRLHLLVRFRDVPTEAQAEALRGQGISILAYVPDSGLVVSAPDGAAFEVGEILTATPLARQDKLSPALALQTAQAAESRLLMPQFYLVEFHPDVSRLHLVSIVQDEGFEVLEHPDLLPHHAVVRGPRERLAALADWDEVAYVFPASEDLVMGRRVAACPGAITAQGPVGQYAASVGEGWDGPGQGSASLGYFFERLTAKLPQDGARNEILRAMREWTRYASVGFFPASSTAASRTLNVLFSAGNHGDAYPFDGPSRVLAHTFYPAPPNPEPVAGDMHFDDAEEWVIGPDLTIRSIDLFSVALHETGHALGLAHSDVPGSVLYPYYRRVTALATDDIASIRELYAAVGDSAAPLTLEIRNPASFPLTTSATTLDISGAVTGGNGDVSVRWSSDRGVAGMAAGGRTWAISALPLEIGANAVTITATDAVPAETSRTVFITRQEDARLPEIRITSPTSGSNYTSASASVKLAGTASHASGIARVEWRNARGGSGLASGTMNWGAGPVALQSGSNEIRVTAIATSGGLASAVLTVSYQPPARDTVAPTLKILSPSSTNVSTRSATITLSGAAADNVGVTQVTWSTSAGASGLAAGTENWTAQVRLLTGTNTVVIRAYDATGNFSWRSVTVTRR